MVLSGASPQLEQLGLVGVVLARFLDVRASLTLVQMVRRNTVIEFHWMEGGRRLVLVVARAFENSLDVMLIMLSAT